MAQDRFEVAAVSISGNTVFSTNALMAEGIPGPGTMADSASLQQARERVVGRYRDEGYLFAEVETKIVGSGPARNVVLSVHEGKPAIVDSVLWTGIRAFSPEDLLGVMTTGPGDPLVRSRLEADIRNVLRLYETRGFPAARASVEDLALSGEDDRYGCVVHLQMDEGIRAAVEEVRITGNTFTREEVILRQMALRLPAPFSDQFAGEARRSLERTGWFASVGHPEFLLGEDGKGELMITVREGDPNRFDGMIGYAPGVAGAKGAVTGLADVQFRNLFGTGRKFTAHWMKESALTQELSLSYFEPWVASLPVDLDVGWFQRKQDSSYIAHRYAGNAMVRFTDELALGATFTASDVVPAERVTASGPAASSWSVGASVRYDSRDHPVTPTAGAFYATTVEAGRSSVGEATDAVRRLSFDVEVYHTFARNQVLAGALHGRDVSSSVVADADLFRLGGATTLRGYRENQFRGSRIAWSSLEYRLLTGGASYVFAFLDAGYIRIPDAPLSGLVHSELTRWGYGAGTRLETGIGLITVGLAFGEGDTFRSAKLHVRIVNEF